MEAGGNVFTTEYESGRMKEFEKRILTEGGCGPMLPVSFMRFGGRERASCDCSGYAAVEDMEIRSSMEMVVLLEKCALAVIDMCGHLVNPRRMELSAGTVFYSEGRKEVRFACVPRDVPAEKARDVFAGFLSSMEKCMRGKEMAGYLASVQSSLESGGGLEDAVNHMGKLKQEIHACGWEDVG